MVAKEYKFERADAVQTKQTSTVAARKRRDLELAEPRSSVTARVEPSMSRNSNRPKNASIASHAAARRPFLSSQVDPRTAALSHRVDIYSFSYLCIFLRLFSTFGSFNTTKQIATIGLYKALHRIKEYTYHYTGV